MRKARKKKLECKTSDKKLEHKRPKYWTDPAWRAHHILKSKAWYQANKDKVLAKLRAAYKANPQPFREKSGRHRRALLNHLLIEQQGRCTCCGTCNPGHKNGWQVHHIHMPGTGYAVLCAKCNSASAWFRDDPILLRRMADINESLTPKG